MKVRTLPAALCLAALSAGFAHAALTTEVPPACHSVDVSDTSGVTAETAAALRDRGYTGDPRDGQERLYGPHCPNAKVASLLIEHRSR